MERVSKTELLQMLWKMYRRQKSFENGEGIDTSADEARMKEWFVMGRDGETTENELELRFPDKPAPEGKYRCNRCRDQGWYFSDDAEFEVRSYKGERTRVEHEGYVVCWCSKGSAKQEAIVKHGKTRAKRGTKFA